MTGEVPLLDYVTSIFWQTWRQKERSDFLSDQKSVHKNWFPLRIFDYNKKSVRVRWT